MPLFRSARGMTRLKNLFRLNPSTKTARSLASPQSHRLELLSYKSHDVDHKYNEKTDNELSRSSKGVSSEAIN